MRFLRKSRNLRLYRLNIDYADVQSENYDFFRAFKVGDPE
jgi:hypothetical protein